MILWSAGIVLALGLVWFVGAVVVPVWRVRAVITQYKQDSARHYGLHGPSAWFEDLGGKERACKLLARYVYWPPWVAPDKHEATELLTAHSEGRELLAAMWVGRQLPEATRVTMANVFGRPSGDLDGLDSWCVGMLAKGLGDRSSRVRVAAASGILRWDAVLTIKPKESSVALDQLARCLKDSDVEVRRTAADEMNKRADGIVRDQLFGEAIVFASLAEPALKAALNDPDKHVRTTVAEVLKKICGEEIPK